MKNSKGIVIKPGQKWKNTATDMVEIVSVVVGRGVLLENLTKCRMVALSETGATTLKTLLLSHDGADLQAASAEGWDVWVEGMEKPDPEKVAKAEVWGTAKRWLFEPAGDVKKWHKAAYRYKLVEEEPEKPEPEPVAADESCHVLTQLIIDAMPYEILENAYWEFDAMRKMSKSTERDAFKRVARMTVNATVNHLLSSLK